MTEVVNKSKRGEQVYLNMNEFLHIQGDGNVTKNLKLAINIFRDPRRNIANQGLIRAELSTSVYGGELTDYEAEAIAFQQKADKKADSLNGKPVFDKWLFVKGRPTKGAHYLQEYTFE